MGIKERKEREKLEMRDLILKAATEMFLAEGYEKTSIRAIANKIEYSVGTIYLYFKDKAELVHEIRQQGFQMMNIVLHASEANEDKLHVLKEMGKAYIKFGMQNPEYYDLMFLFKKPAVLLNTVDADQRYLKGEGKIAFGNLHSIVVECINQGKIRFRDPNVASLAIWSFLHGLVSLQIRERLRMFRDSDPGIFLPDSFIEYIDAIST